MNKNLIKQIKTYAGVASAIIVADKASGQVIYHDVIPDDTTRLYGPALYYDINQDGDTDFVFVHTYMFSTHGHSCQSASSALVAFGKSSSNDLLLGASPAACGHFAYFHHASLFIIHDTIPKSVPTPQFDRWITFENWMLQSCSFGSSTSSCFSAAGPLNQDKCVGIKFIISGQTHYGWIRVELLQKKLVIKDYAYQLQPNVPILACDTTNLATGITETNPQFNFTQQNNSIHVSTFQKLNHASISVYDLLGKEIYSQIFTGTQTEITIDKKGIYVVEVISNKVNLKKKIFIY